MSAPQEQIIIDTLATWMREIRRAAGYYTDAGLRVCTDEGDLPEEAEAESLFVIDQGAAAIGKGKWALAVLIEGLVLLAETDHPPALRPIARQLNADITRVLRAHHRMNQLPAGVTELRETAREIPRREEGSSLLTPSITLEITYSDLYQEK